MPSQTGRRRRDHSPFPPIVVVLDGKQRQKEEEERCASEAAGDGPTFAKWNPSARAPVAQSLTQMWSNPSSAISLMSPFSSLLPPFFRRRRSDSCDDIDRIAPPSSLPFLHQDAAAGRRKRRKCARRSGKDTRKKRRRAERANFCEEGESATSSNLPLSVSFSPPSTYTSRKGGGGGGGLRHRWGQKTLVLSPSPGKTRMLYLRRRPHLL